MMYPKGLAPGMTPNATNNPHMGVDSMSSDATAAAVAAVAQGIRHQMQMAAAAQNYSEAAANLMGGLNPQSMYPSNGGSANLTAKPKIGSPAGQISIEYWIRVTLPKLFYYSPSPK
jgi:hypothetical protein